MISIHIEVSVVEPLSVVDVQRWLGKALDDVEGNPFPDGKIHVIEVREEDA